MNHTKAMTIGVFLVTSLMVDTMDKPKTRPARGNYSLKAYLERLYYGMGAPQELIEEYDAFDPHANKSYSHSPFYYIRAPGETLLTSSFYEENYFVFDKYDKIKVPNRRNPWYYLKPGTKIRKKVTVNKERVSFVVALAALRWISKR